MGEHRDFLRQAHPSALSIIVYGVLKHKRSLWRQLHSLVEGWGGITVTCALQLLGCDDSYIRAHAVKCLDKLCSDRSLRLYTLQLSQALKREPHHDSALARLMMRRSILYPARVGHNVYWALQAESSNPSCSMRSGLMLNIFLRYCGAYRRDLGQQCYVMQRLMSLQARVKAGSSMDEKLELMRSS